MFSLRNLLILNLFLGAALVFFLVSGFKGKQPTDNSPQSPEQIVRSISLKKDFSFCGEPFPMDNFDVQQRLDQELLRNVYYHSHTILAIKRAGSIFPIIEPILKEEGAPDDLKYLAVAESVLSNAVSPAGARGVWQFMKGAGIEHGLEINSEIDERYHLEKATRAACKYMKSQYKKQGSWIAAAAAYNGGPGRISTEMEKQEATSFFDLNLAADETMRYPFRIVAIKEVMEHPENYEYIIPKEHLYQPLDDYKIVEVNDSVESWAAFAKKHGISYRTLKVYNPWLISSQLTNKSKKTYEIRIPK
ncbi:MAG: lytic transglycosylase domain-containing protein [Saprospiraceae bacterium]|jgi:hypothetical protein